MGKDAEENHTGKDAEQEAKKADNKICHNQINFSLQTNGT